MSTLRILLISVALGAAVSVAGQTAPAPTPPVARTPDALMPTPPPNFTYSPEGRRDPFVNLSKAGTVAPPPSVNVRPAGVPGLLVDELVVRGIMLSQGAYVAMVSGPTGQTYTVRAGSRLFDGTVRAITPQAVVIMQQVSDPLSLQKQREVRKPLRVQEEGK